jgi:hypothetical protein
MLESLIGDVYRTNTQLPLAYGGMYADAYNPLYNYYTQGAGNMTSLGGQSMGLYGNLASQSMEAQRFNALAPALAGLLNQYGSFGGADGLNLSFGQISDPMSGYGGVVSNAYRQARSYDDDMRKAQKDMMGNLPKAPYMMQPGMTYGSPNPPPQPPQQQPQDRPGAGQQFSPGGGRRGGPTPEAGRGRKNLGQMRRFSTGAGY